MSAYSDFIAKVASYVQTGVRRNVTAAHIRELFTDLADATFSVAGNSPLFLEGVTALTGSTAAALDHAIPDGLSLPFIVIINSPAGFSDIGVPPDTSVEYILRAKSGDVADGYNKIQPVNAGYSSAILVRAT